MSDVCVAVMSAVSGSCGRAQYPDRGITPEPRFYDTRGMDEETAYENRPFAPRDQDPRDLVSDLHNRCEALRRQLRALGEPMIAAEADEWLAIEAEIDELESRIVAIEEGIR